MSAGGAAALSLGSMRCIQRASAYWAFRYVSHLFYYLLFSSCYFKEHVTSSVDLSVEERMSFGMRAPTASLRAEYVLIVTGYSPK